MIYYWIVERLAELAVVDQQAKIQEMSVKHYRRSLLNVSGSFITLFLKGTRRTVIENSGKKEIDIMSLSLCACLLLFITASPLITGCQKLSEKFGYEPPIELTRSNYITAHVKEPNRWIPCTEVCLSKEIPRIRNTVLQIENNSRVEFENLKAEFAELKVILESIKLNHGRDQDGRREKDLDFNGTNVRFFSTPDCVSTQCENAFKSRDVSASVNQLPFFIGFSYPTPVDVSKVSFRLFDANSNRTNFVERTITYQIMVSKGEDCINIKDVSWTVIQQEQKMWQYQGEALSVTLNEFESDAFSCYGVNIKKSSFDAMLKMSNVRMKALG